MPIFTFTQFKLRTDKDRVGGLKGIILDSDLARGAEIRLIDSALKNYRNFTHKNSTQQKYREQEVAFLNQLAMACLGWLGKKKGAFKNSLAMNQHHVASPLNIRRKAAIKELANETMRELYVKITAYGFITVDNMGLIKFNYKKFIAKQNPNAMPALNPLSQSYGEERLAYVQSGKKRSIAAGHVHQLHKGLANNYNNLQVQNGGNAPVNQQVTTSFRDYFGVQNVHVPDAIRLAQANVDALTVNDWQILEQIAADSNGNSEVGQTQYLTRDERVRYIAVPDGVGMLCDFNNQLITTPGEYMYAMDEGGNLMINDQDNFDQVNYALFNHSGFNAGKDVICAGTLIINNGTLVRISNNSGHYKPSQVNLYNCILVLAADGVQLNHTVVQCFMHNSQCYHMYNGLQFSQNMNCNPLVVTSNEKWKNGDSTDPNHVFNKTV